MPAVLRTLSARGSYTRQLVMTSDHGTLGLDWWCGADKPTYAAPDAPIVLFIHGINGGLLFGCHLQHIVLHRQHSEVATWLQHYLQAMVVSPNAACKGSSMFGGRRAGVQAGVAQTSGRQASLGGYEVVVMAGWLDLHPLQQ